MTRQKENTHPPFGRIVSVCLMVFCLLFLTSLNYFLYPSDGDGKTSTVKLFGHSEESDSDYPPSGPTEEKGCSNNFSIAEEILHEQHSALDFKAFNHLYLHHIAEAEKIQIVHPELILRPPRS